ncbi:MAG TPA: type II secretion system F family protein [candidate division Zixibacteria bacterium]|nr:type II secretion system F family protein [candidate division Zixibacteria bacterium]
MASDSFVYTGRDSAGAKVRGAIAADSESRALDLLQERGVIVTSLAVRLSRPGRLRPDFLRPNYSEYVALMARHFATYHRTGIPLLKALSLIRVTRDSHPFQAALVDIARSVGDGRTLSSAFADHPRIFNSVVVSAVEAGEASGQLAEILDETAATLESELELRRQIRSALRYPAIVVAAIALAMVVIMTIVVPRFASFYGKFGADLPTPTQIVVWFSTSVRTYWYLALAAACACGWGLWRLYLTERGRFFWDGLCLRTPIFGPLIIKAAVARFALLLKILFRSGIPLVRALSILAAAQENVHLRNEVTAMRESFESGRELERTDDERYYFPEMARNMIRSGLASGSLELMLGEIGRHYSREVNHTSRSLAALIEPALTALIGAVILVLALAIFLPMWNMIKIFQ